MAKKKTKKDDKNVMWWFSYTTYMENIKNQKEELERLKVCHRNNIKSYEQRIKAIVQLRHLEVDGLLFAIDNEQETLRWIDTQLKKLKTKGKK